METAIWAVEIFLLAAGALLVVMLLSVPWLDAAMKREEQKTRDFIKGLEKEVNQMPTYLATTELARPNAYVAEDMSIRYALLRENAKLQADKKRLVDALVQIELIELLNKDGNTAAYDLLLRAKAIARAALKGEPLSSVNNVRNNVGRRIDRKGA